MAWTDVFSTDADVENARRQQMLDQQGKLQYGFGAQAGQNFNAGAGGITDMANYLQGIVKGGNSPSQMQLGQNLQQQLAQQRSFAASANPNDAAMAARNAAMNMNQASYGMSGQQAMAGLQERNQAAQQLAQLLLQQRQQNLQGYLGSTQNANSAYGAQAGASQGTAMGYGALAGLAGGVASAMSDRRLKRDISAEDDDQKKSREILANLKPYSFKYKDEKFGKGDQYGVMAQDMERAGLAHAVTDTPYGKMVHAGKAATSALALTASLARRLEELEKEREGRGRRSAESDDGG